MKPAITMLACLAALSTAAFAQQSTSSVTATTISPVAYVYVSSSPTTGKFEITAYKADSTGRLTPVIGSPFSADVQDMALNGKWLFGTNGTYIYSFRIESDGAVQQVSMINAAVHNPSPSGGPTFLFLDHTGATLYDGDTYAYGTGSNAYQSFSIDQTTGQLNYLAITPDGGPTVGSVLSFTGSNVFDVVPRALEKCMERPFGAAYLTLCAREALKPAQVSRLKAQGSRFVQPVIEP